MHGNEGWWRRVDLICDEFVFGCMTKKDSFRIYAMELKMAVLICIHVGYLALIINFGLLFRQLIQINYLTILIELPHRFIKTYTRIRWKTHEYIKLNQK